MENGRRQGHTEELFLRRPGAEPNTPTVGPLRIHKGGSASPPPSQKAIPNSQLDGFPRPPNSQSYEMPSSRPPAGPLPRPEDTPNMRHPHGRSPYPNDSDQHRVSSPEQHGRSGSSGASSGTSHRARFEANDPNRPTLVGYASDPHPALTHTEKRSRTPTPVTVSQSPETPGSEGLFQKRPHGTVSESTQDNDKRPSQPEINPYPDYHQQYWPPSTKNQPVQKSSDPGLRIPSPQGVNRLSSTASTSTTKAQRGSPPPPETPATDQPAAGGIEARYAAAGIAGASTLSNLQAQSAAAFQRANEYSGQTGRAGANQPQVPYQRPWTPTEQPGSHTHGPSTIYQGTSQIQGNSGAPVASQLPEQATQSPQPSSRRTANTGEANLENDIQRLGVSDEPPPSYSSVTQPGHGSGAAAQNYPTEKVPAQSSTSTAPTASNQTSTPIHQTHPAFANETRHQANSNPNSQISIVPAQQNQRINSPAPVAGSGPRPASPPPLPEGWIAHLDPSSGQYYYIHLQTQSTQWEFPKGPTPLNLTEPLSPTGTFVNPLTSPSVTSVQSKPLASPIFAPQTASFGPDSISSVGISSPTAAGFTGPPPSSGVDMYKVAPTNGVYFGPYLRYTNMDIERGLWLGSILLVTDAPQPPVIHIHQSVDLSPNPRQLKANPIYSHQRWMFFRYDIDLKMDEDHETKWTYAITSHLGCTRYEFLIAGRHERSWRFIAHSGNDFSLNVNVNERQRIGGIGYMWKDILQKHIDCGGFHVQLGLGDQIYADRLWKELPLLKQWTSMSGKDNRKNAQWTAKHEEEIVHAYFHYYSSHFDQPHLREAFAQIPYVLTLDDHDIFDGFGSYPEYMQLSNMFKNIGRIGIEMYLLFQHHTTLGILHNVSGDQDLFTITGTGWHFLKYLGPAVVLVGPDTRSERTRHQVMAGPTYQGLFPKVAMLPPTVQHCIWMLPVPMVYPRLESAEQIANTVATGKKAVTGTFNVLGKVTSSVAGVVGAKQVVGEGFNSVKKAVGKSGLMSGVLSPFGDIDILDELRDQWTHESKDLERTYLIRTLQGISHNKSLRITFFSGDVNCCGAGLVHDPSRPSDHKTMYQIISSAVVNAPPSSYVLRLLHNNKPIYVPQNGHRSTHAPSDTKEDMMEIFTQDINGQPRELRRLMGRRNYVACVAYDPDVVNGTFGKAVPGYGNSKLSLAVDFMVQNEVAYGATVKYGPVIIPSLEYGQ